PGHQMVKNVNDELTSMLGDDFSELKLASSPPTVILMMGLQGSGKTTTVGKLANRFKQKGKNCLLVPADVYRPAAIEQLNVIGRELEIEVYQAGGEKDPVKICVGAVEAASKKMIHVVILDTAGRLQIDDELMAELKAIKEKVTPHESLFIADAMMGQQAADVASTFNEVIGIDGVILTKMDGDARGGAALSIKSVTGGKPIRFIGTGEKLDALEPFHPERIVSRILGMGDVMSLVEKAEQAYDLEEQKELEKKIRKNAFTLEDFKDQLQQMQKMGSIEQLIGMIPGAKKLKGLKVDERAFVKIEAIIDSMTPRERNKHNIVNSSRKRRIARGSGTSVNDVNKLLKQFAQMQKMMKRLTASKGRGFNLGSMMGGRGISPF
ncbi:MAG: signal recognition particle protein, partial [Nitrospinae bacterium]|nr:signal recognition particle protein [Nitrospinota bacterium]